MKKKNFIISWEIYPFDVMVSIGQSHAELVKRIKRTGYKLNDEEREKLWMRGNGRTVMLEGGQTIIRLDTKDHSVIAHEVFHAVDFLFSRIENPLIIGNEETYAYAIGFLTRKIYEKLK